MSDPKEGIAELSVPDAGSAPKWVRRLAIVVD